MAEVFTKVSDSVSLHDSSFIRLKGEEKAAILLGELANAAPRVMDCLNKKEIRKLSKTMKKLGCRYDPWNPGEVKREVAVLEEAKKYGTYYGIYRDVAAEKRRNESASGNSKVIKEIRNADVKDIARVLGAWITEDK